MKKAITIARHMGGCPHGPFSDPAIEQKSNIKQLLNLIEKEHMWTILYEKHQKIFLPLAEYNLFVCC